MLRLRRRPSASCSATACEIGEGVLFGAHVVVHDGTRDRRRLRDRATAPCSASRRGSRARSTAPRAALPPLRIGARVTVCAGAVVYAGSEIGDEAIVGDQAQVRERTTSASGR